MSKDRVISTTEERYSRPHIPPNLKPSLDKEQTVFEAKLRKGIQFRNSPDEFVQFKLEDRVANPGKRLLINSDNGCIGFVDLAGYSSPDQYEVDLTYHLTPKFRGRDILEAGIEMFNRHLHNQGVIVINIPQEEFDQKQF